MVIVFVSMEPLSMSKREFAQQVGLFSIVFVTKRKKQIQLFLSNYFSRSS